MPNVAKDTKEQTVTHATPGPWTVKQGTDARDFIVAEPTGNTVCEPNIETFLSPNEFDPSVRRIPLDEALANARLIAAAPDLLVALKSIVEHEQIDGTGIRYCFDFNSPFGKQARAAIAKAEGRS